jgi:hypothetical protein
MIRKALSLIVAAFVLLSAAAVTVTVASMSKSVTPKLGYYKGPEGRLPGISATGVKVVKMGKHRGAEFEVSFELMCPHSSKTPQVMFGWVVETPIRIKNGEFEFDRTIHSHVATWEGSAERGITAPGTSKLVVSGLFRSATKVIVEASATGTYDVQYEGQSSEKVECSGTQTATAKLKH